MEGSFSGFNSVVSLLEKRELPGCRVTDARLRVRRGRHGCRFSGPHPRTEIESARFAGSMGRGPENRVAPGVKHRKRFSPFRGKPACDAARGIATRYPAGKNTAAARQALADRGRRPTQAQRDWSSAGFRPEDAYWPVLVRLEPGNATSRGRNPGCYPERWPEVRIDVASLRRIGGAVCCPRECVIGDASFLRWRVRRCT